MAIEMPQELKDLADGKVAGNVLESPVLFLNIAIECKFINEKIKKLVLEKQAELLKKGIEVPVGQILTKAKNVDFGEEEVAIVMQKRTEMMTKMKPENNERKSTRINKTHPSLENLQLSANTELLTFENVSVGGISFISTRNLNKGQRFEINLDFDTKASRPAIFQLEIEIVNIFENNKFGAKFINIDPKIKAKLNQRIGSLCLEQNN